MFFQKESQSLHVKDSVFFFRELVQQLSTITAQQRKVLAGAFALHIGEGQVSLTRKPSFQARQALTRCGRKPWKNDRSSDYVDPGGNPSRRSKKCRALLGQERRTQRSQCVPSVLGATESQYVRHQDQCTP